MNKKIYIIPGQGESCDLIRYRNLTKSLEGKGYEVIPVNPNWYKPLSEQVFPVEKDAVIFGFSFGAILAYLIAIKFSCKKVIFCSISPIHQFSYRSLVKDCEEHMPKDEAVAISVDIKRIKVSLKSLTVPFVTLAGEYEKMKADFLVPATGHRITPAYIKCIVNLL